MEIGIGLAGTAQRSLAFRLWTTGIMFLVLAADRVRQIVARQLPCMETTERGVLNRKASRYFEEYGNAILRLAYSYVHNMADEEDILQESLIRILQADPQFENAAHERAYILRTTANAAKNHLAYSKRRETDELSEELVAEKREDLSFVWEAVKQLPEISREVLHLHYYEGYKTAEIAAILRRREATV